MTTEAGQAASDTMRQLQQAAGESWPAPALRVKSVTKRPEALSSIASPAAAGQGMQHIAPPAPAGAAAPAPGAAAPPTENGLESLMEDHRTILRLFDQYRSVRSQDAKLVVVDELVRAVSLHASAEQRFLYPLVLSKMHAGRALYDRQVMDDQVSKQLLHWLEEHKPAAAEEWALFDETLLKFALVEEEHLRQEERAVLEPLRGVMDAQELAQLHANLLWAKSYGPTHPHPSAPSTSPAANIVHPVAGIYDRVVDALKTSGIADAVGFHRTTPGEPLPAAKTMAVAADRAVASSFHEHNEDVPTAEKHGPGAGAVGTGNIKDVVGIPPFAAATSDPPPSSGAPGAGRGMVAMGGEEDGRQPGEEGGRVFMGSIKDVVGISPATATLALHPQQPGAVTATHGGGAKDVVRFADQDGLAGAGGEGVGGGRQEGAGGLVSGIKGALGLQQGAAGGGGEGGGTGKPGGVKGMVNTMKEKVEKGRRRLAGEPAEGLGGAGTGPAHVKFQE